MAVPNAQLGPEEPLKKDGQQPVYAWGGISISISARISISIGISISGRQLRALVVLVRRQPREPFAEAQHSEK